MGAAIGADDADREMTRPWGDRRKRLGDGIGLVAFPLSSHSVVEESCFQLDWGDLTPLHPRNHPVTAAKVHEAQPTPEAPCPELIAMRTQTPGIGSEYQRQLEVEGTISGIRTSAVPDLGSAFDIVSEEFAIANGFKLEGARKRVFTLLDGTKKKFSGTITAPWVFWGEPKSHQRTFQVLKGCVHDVILGQRFLNMTRTFKKFRHRLKTVFVPVTSPIRRLLYIDDSDQDDDGMLAAPRAAQRLLGMLDGRCVGSLADTCSDLPVIRRSVAVRLGLEIQQGPGCRTKVQFVDGSVGSTTGLVRDVRWSFGLGQSVDDSHRIDFHVMDDIPCSVILNLWLLLDNEVFLKYEDFFFDSPVACRLIEEPVLLIKKIKEAQASGTALDPLEEEAVRRSEFEDRVSSMSPADQIVARREEELRREHGGVVVSVRGAGAAAGFGQDVPHRRLGSGFRRVATTFRSMCGKT
jgi:hypothetical protein